MQQHPERTPLLEEARAFPASLGEAHLLDADPPGDELLAFFIATPPISAHPRPAPLQEMFDRIEEKLKGDVALRARHAEMIRRMAVLAAATDPAKQFERLSGHRLAPTRPEIPTLDAEDFTDNGVLVAAVASLDRHPVLHSLWTRIRRWMVTAIPKKIRRRY